MSKSTVTVLLVDDDADVVWGMQTCLRRAGFVVEACRNGEEAVTSLGATDFDVVVTDIMMPKLNGLGLLQSVGENRPCTKIVVMTAFGSSSLKNLIRQKGALLYMEKPVDPELLIGELRKLCGGAGAGRKI